VVLRALASQLDGLNDLYEGQPGRAAFRAFARARLEPAFAALGWDPKPAEPDNAAILRRTLITTLASLDDPAVVAEARRRFAAWLANPNSLTGTSRQTVLQIVAEHADAAEWDQLHALAQKATNVTDRSRLYRDLAIGHDPALADKALTLALTSEPSATDAPELISGVSVNFPEKAFDFALAHRAQVEAMVEPTSRVSFFARLASGARSAAILPRLQAFAATVPASTRGEITKAVSTIEVRAEIVAKRLREVDRWLTNHPG
jgi:hypothetical protein